MKKTILYVLPLVALTAACGGNDGSDANGGESKKIVVDSFYSADRAFADLRGDALQCVTVIRDMEMIDDTLSIAQESLTTTTTESFDANGYIASVVREDVFMDQPVGKSVFTFEFDSIGSLINSATDIDGRFTVKRDKNGYVSSFTSISNTGDIDYTQVYTWNGSRLATQQIASERRPVNEDGTYIPVPIDKVKYIYDDKGYLLSESEESGDPQLQLNYTETTYDYKDYDEHGNWTSRYVTRIAKVYTMSPRKALTDSVATYQSEVRTISYR